MADTAALVVALSAQMTKFEKDMKAAGGMAERAVGDIEDKFSKMNPQIKTSFLGNFFADLAGKALDAAIKGVQDLVERFNQLQKAAEYAGVSIQWLYGIQAAGAAAGAGLGDMLTAVKSITFSLDEMKRGGDNALKTLLDANPQFLKGVKRDALDVEQTLRIVGNIIQALPNEVQRVDVAKNLGLPESTVAALRQGGDALAKIAREAAEGAPDLARAAAASDALAKAWAEFTKNVTSGWAENIRTGLQYIVSILLAIQQFEAKLMTGGPLEGIANRELAKWEKISEIVNAPATKTEAGVKVRIPTGGGATDPFARKAGGSATNEYDRQSKSLEKHIATMEADTKTVGQNVGAQEAMRVQAQLTTAAQQQFGTVTAETSAKIEAQAEAAGRAKLALAQAQYQFNELNAASKEFGSALSEAFKGMALEGKKLNEVLSQLLKRLANKLIDKAFDMIFAAPGTGGSSAFLSLFSGGKAGGGPVSGGSSYLVGEKGPELFTPSVSGMIHPNDVLRGAGAGGGGAFNYAPAIDARGASVEAVARLAQILEQDRAAFATKTIAVVQQARRGRVPGL